MCGFIGNFSFTGKKHIFGKNLREITKSIEHRGPDGEGYFEDKFISLGFKRLSIIDLKNGNQPFVSKNNRFVIVFNGEIYNYKEIQSDIINSGQKLKTNSDTETLIEAISLWGIEYIKKVNGMFSFVLYDKLIKKIFLVRDRLGIKPLYYFKKSDNFIFGSEIQSLLKTGFLSKELNYNAISSYLSFRNPIGVGNYFKEIREIEPGQIVTIDQNIKKNNYWKIPSFINDNDKGLEYYENTTKELLLKVIKEHMISDVNVGSLLSGGLDSSLITVLMDKENINTYSASFDQSEYDETKFANILSKSINSNHKNINLNSNDYIDKLENNIEKRGTPLSIPHEIALNELFAEISTNNKVVMSGEGADELFGGYGRVQSSAFDYKKILFIKKNFPQFIQNYFNKILGGRGKFNWLSHDNQLNHFFEVYCWFSKLDKDKILSQEFIEKISRDEEVNNFWLNEFKNIDKLNEYDKILYMFQKHHLRCLLDRLDFHSMSSGVEARVPFCDHRLVEHVMNIPHKYKFHWKSIIHKIVGIFNNSFYNSEKLDISKYLLRRCSHNIVPHQIVYRKKKVFLYP